jgi:hypothetical protein
MSTIKTLDLALIDLRAGLSKELHLSQVALADITRAFNTAFESMEALQAAVNNAFAERTLALEMALGTASERQEQSEKQGAGDEASAAPRKPKLAAANG